MKEQKRIRALLLCIAFVLMLFVSASYLVHEAGHDCSDDDCPICRTIAMTAELLRAFGLLVTALAVSVAAAVCLYAWRQRTGTAVRTFGTLVSWKIRLND